VRLNGDGYRIAGVDGGDDFDAGQFQPGFLLLP
jgi:hypothetical protein